MAEYLELSGNSLYLKEVLIENGGIIGAFAPGPWEPADLPSFVMADISGL